MAEEAKKEEPKQEEQKSNLPVRVQNMQKIIAANMKALESIAVKSIDPKRFARIAFSFFQRNQRLQECNPHSFLAAMLTGAQLGLEVDGAMGEACIIPYGGYASFQTMYRGLLKLCRNSGEIKDIDADVVRDGDKFIYRKGTSPKLEHEYGKTRGDIKFFWALFRLKSGGVKACVMTLAEVLEHRDKYSKGYWRGEEEIEKYLKNPQNKNATREKAIEVLAKAQKLSGWHTAFEQMGCKTVLIRGSKLVPMSSEVQRQIYKEERMEAGLSIPIERPGAEDELIGEAGEIIEVDFSSGGETTGEKSATETLKEKMKQKQPATPKQEKPKQEAPVEPQASAPPPEVEIKHVRGYVEEVEVFDDNLRQGKKKRVIMLDNGLGYTDLNGFIATAALKAKDKKTKVEIEYEETDDYGPMANSLTFVEE